jgi:hypothetical protein
LDVSNCPTVPELFVELTEYFDGYVTNTSLVPAPKFTNEPALLDDTTVVRDRVVPEAV